VFQVDLFSVARVVAARHPGSAAATRTACIRLAPLHHRRLQEDLQSQGGPTTHGRSEDSGRQRSDNERAVCAINLAHMPGHPILGKCTLSQKIYEAIQDHEFSRTLDARLTGQSGYEDTRRTLMRRDWLAMPPKVRASW